MDYKVISVQEAENVIRYLPKETAKEVLRAIRERECYSIINRGILWYETLSETQKQDLLNWYNSWKDVTETFVIPIKPWWIK